MLAGWRERGLQEAVVVDPSPQAKTLEESGVKVVAHAADIPVGFAPAAVILAVKPQLAPDVLGAYGRFADDSVFVSIMAGKTLATITRLLAKPASIVRAMPNTPAAVGQGFTVAVAGTGVSEAQHTLADDLLRAIGDVAWVDVESILDPVTAISGGGPAYLFLLTELMEWAALQQGIEPALARMMARKTVIGSAALLAASDEEAAALRVAVTSPGGTTERALAILRDEEAWPASFAAAIEAATRRSRELSS